MFFYSEFWFFAIKAAEPVSLKLDHTLRRWHSIEQTSVLKQL